MNKYFANQNELLIVASIIFAETKIEPIPTQTVFNAMAILMVGINRLKNPVRFKCEKGKDKYTLYDIFTAKDQYSCYPDSHQFKKAMAYELSYKEGQAFRHIRSMLEVLDNCDTSNHYYNPKLCAPNWAKGMPVDYTIGNHNFLTLP